MKKIYVMEIEDIKIWISANNAMEAVAQYLNIRDGIEKFNIKEINTNSLRELGA